MKNVTRYFLIGISIGLSMALFSNCNGFKINTDLPSQQGDPNLPPGVLSDQTGDTISAKVLTGDQMLRSFAQLTKVDPALTSVKTEFDLRSSVLADTFNLSAVNAPLLIGVANLTSQFCDQAINNESPAAASARRLFGQVDFSAGLSALSAGSYQSMVNNLAQKFWGRDATSAEQSIMTTARQDFENNYTGNRETAAASRGLVLYTCTGMLASFDTITF